MANKLGRRNDLDMRRHGIVPKSELYDVVGELYELGLGTMIISELLGYSKDYITRVRKGSGAKRRRYTQDVILNLLPDDLKRRALSIRVRSEQFYSSKGKSLRDRHSGAPRDVAI